MLEAIAASVGIYSVRQWYEGELPRVEAAPTYRTPHDWEERRVGKDDACTELEKSETWKAETRRATYLDYIFPVLTASHAKPE